jgi:hypothetical protein
VGCNWKVGFDSFNEAYHVEATHAWDQSGMQLRDGRANFNFNGNRLDAMVRDGGKRVDVRDSTGATPGSYAFLYENFETHNRMRYIPDSMLPYQPPRLGDQGEPRVVALTALENLQQVSLAHQDDIDYVRNLPEVPGDVTSNQFLIDVRRAVGKAGGIDYSHISDDDMISGIQYCLYPNAVGFFGGGNWVLFRFRPNGNDPETCVYDVYFLHRYPEGEEPPKVEHEWYPNWEDHNEWGPILLQDMSNMGYVQQGMHQHTFKGLRLNRQEAGIRNHQRFLDRYLA